MSGFRIALLSLGFVGVAAIPAAAQARATMVASATVLDLREARATIQVATELAGQTASPAVPSRRDLAAASVALTRPDPRTPGGSADPAIAMIVYW